MKKIKDKNKLLKDAEKHYNGRVTIEEILNDIIEIYEIDKPVINNIKINDYIECFLEDKKIEFRGYLITIKDDYVLGKISDKTYYDIFSFQFNNKLKLSKRLYQSDNIQIEQIMNLRDDLPINKYSEAKIKEDRYKFNYKNDVLDSKIEITFQGNNSQISNYFVKKLFSYSYKINNINDLFSVIKDIFDSKDIDITIKNGIEVIKYKNNKLLEYRKIVDDKLYEYKEGYKELLITSFEKDSLKNQEFQKILKIVRS